MKDNVQGLRALLGAGEVLKHVAEANGTLVEYVGNHNQYKPGDPLRAARFRLRTMEEGLGESL